MVTREMLPRNRPRRAEVALLEFSVVFLDIFLRVHRVRIGADVQALEVQSWFLLLGENVLACLGIFISRTTEKKKKKHAQSL